MYVFRIPLTIYVFHVSSLSESNIYRILSGTIVKGGAINDHPAKFDLIWFSSFREEDLNVKVYDVRRSDGWTIIKAHMAFDQLSYS